MTKNIIPEYEYISTSPALYAEYNYYNKNIELSNLNKSAIKITENLKTIKKNLRIKAISKPFLSTVF